MRPPERRSSVAAVAAVVAGERAGICMIAVPSLIRSVRPPIHARGDTASDPYASDVHTEWNPQRSASSARPTQNAGSSYPSCKPRRTRRSYSGRVALPARVPRRTRALPRVHGGARLSERGGDRPGGRRRPDAARGASRSCARGRAVGAARSARGGRDRVGVPLLRLPQRGDRALGVRAARVRLPGTRRRQRGDPPSVRHGRSEGALPAAARLRRGALVLLDDRAGGGGVGSDAAADEGRTRRRRVGRRRAQVVLERRGRSGVRDRLCDLRSRRRAAPARDDDPRAGRHGGCRGRSARARHGACGARLEHPLRGAVHGRAGARREHPGWRGRCLPPRPEAARPGADPPRDALARADAEGVRADVPVRERAGGVRRAARGQADGAELGRGLGCGDPGLPPADDGRRARRSTRARRRASRCRSSSSTRPRCSAT